MRLLIFLSALFSCAAFAQVNVSISPNRKNYIAYEPVKLTVTLQNLSGEPLALHNTFERPWIEFIVTRHSGEVMSQIQKIAYPAVTVPIGQTVSSTFIINNAYDMSAPGNYTCYAIVRAPNQDARNGSRSANAHFTVTRGITAWQQKVGVPNIPGDERAYRIINFSGDGTPLIYIQVEDTKRGRILSTYSMGRNVAFRESVQMIDSSNHLHVLFQTTPQLHCHTVVDLSGKTIQRSYHKSYEVGRPSLATSPEGIVQVANSIPYNPVKEAADNAKFHDLSEVPGGIRQ